MSVREAPKKAKLLQALVYYDGPQLAVLCSDKNNKMLAVAIKHDNLSYPFFCCELREKDFEGYMGQKFDLSFALKQAFGAKYFFFDLQSADNDMVDLIPVPRSKQKDPIYWPEAGFFASSHTEDYEGEEKFSGAEQVIMIDGRWSPSEFSKLHNKFSDIYAILSAIKMLADNKTCRKQMDRIAKTVRDKFWRGGGSYVGFFDDLEADLSIPLELNRVQYASPGEIAFNGDEGILADVLDSMYVYRENESRISEIARSINNILNRERIKSAKIGTEFSSDAVSNYVKSQTSNMFESMGIDQTDQLFIACLNDVAIYAKIALAHFRRVRDLHRFFEQGRLEFKK